MPGCVRIQVRACCCAESACVSLVLDLPTAQPYNRPVTTRSAVTICHESGKLLPMTSCSLQAGVRISLQGCMRCHRSADSCHSRIVYSIIVHVYTFNRSTSAALYFLPSSCHSVCQQPSHVRPRWPQQVLLRLHYNRPLPVAALLSPDSRRPPKYHRPCLQPRRKGSYSLCPDGHDYLS